MFKKIDNLLSINFFIILLLSVYVINCFSLSEKTGLISAAIYVIFIITIIVKISVKKVKIQNIKFFLFINLFFSLVFLYFSYSWLSQDLWNNEKTFEILTKYVWEALEGFYFILLILMFSWGLGSNKI